MQALTRSNFQQLPGKLITGESGSGEYDQVWKSSDFIILFKNSVRIFMLRKPVASKIMELLLHYDFIEVSLHFYHIFILFS